MTQQHNTVKKSIENELTQEAEECTAGERQYRLIYTSIMTRTAA